MLKREVASLPTVLLLRKPSLSVELGETRVPELCCRDVAQDPDPSRQPVDAVDVVHQHAIGVDREAPILPWGGELGEQLLEAGACVVKKISVWCETWRAVTEASG